MLSLVYTQENQIYGGWVSVSTMLHIQQSCSSEKEKKKETKKSPYWSPKLWVDHWVNFP